MGWLKKKWQWYSKLGPLNKFGVTCGIIGTIGVILSVLFWIFPYDTDQTSCQVTSSEVCRQLLVNISADKTENQDNFNDTLKRKYDLTPPQLQILANNFKAYAKTDYDKGLALAILGNYSEAIQHYDVAIALERTNEHYYLGKATAQFFMTDYNAGLATMNRYMNVSATGTHVTISQPSLVLYARLLEEVNRSNDAVQVYDIILEQTPHDADIWNDRGTTLAKQKKYEEALFSFNRAIETGNSKDITTLRNKAGVLIELGRYSEAIEIYSLILQLEPGNWKELDNRGYAYFRLGEYENALQDALKALDMEGDNPSACRLSNVGEALTVLNRTQEAITYFKNAQKLDRIFLQTCKVEVIPPGDW